jgi:pseudouridine-5'-phosphate glycosidase/pseudouridine kinase
VEDIVRGHGVVPASIGIIDGLIHVGLTSSQLERLAVPDQKRIKVSKRDIPYVLSNRLSGGTTVSGTLSIAHKVGIPLFVTGGMGGVHRDGHISQSLLPYAIVILLRF